MSKSPELTFRKSVQRSLAKLDPQITSALLSLIKHPYPPEVFALSFEVFSDGFTSGFPVRVFFMDRSNTEHFVVEDGVANYPSPIDPGLIEIECVYPEKLEEALEKKAPELDIWEVATEELINWFAGHWNRSGGAKFPLAATIACHDSSKEFNLKSGLWQPSYAVFDL
jgi:hypothetical protein